VLRVSSCEYLNKKHLTNLLRSNGDTLKSKKHFRTSFVVHKAKVIQKTVVLVERPMAIGYKIAKGKSKKQETRNTRYDKGDKI